MGTLFRYQKTQKNKQKKCPKIDGQNHPKATRVQGLKIARNTAPVHKSQRKLRFEDFKKTTKNAQPRLKLAPFERPIIV